MEDFNLRNYLYNNPLLEEEKEEEKPKGKKSKPKKSKEEDINEDTNNSEESGELDIRLSDEADGPKVKKIGSKYGLTFQVKYLGDKDWWKHSLDIGSFKSWAHDMRDAGIEYEITTSTFELPSIDLHVPVAAKYKLVKEDVKEEKLREYIRGKITSILQEEEKEDVDVEDEENVDVDVKKEVDVEDTEEEDITIDDEESEVETDIDVKMPGGLDPAVETIQGLLTKAQQEAEKLGDPKLLDQIGNTITFFTRKHVVKGGLTELRKNKK